MVLPLTNPTKSYWIEAAESPLRDHRSTEELPKEVDVVIVGSGYTGVTSAYWLHRYTQRDETPSMLLLEARDVCGGATGRNGGQLRPHWYSRYTPWAQRFGAQGALDLIKHEAAHLSAFKHIFEEEGIADKVCFKLGETFDAAMSQEAWDRLHGCLEQMKKDHGEDDEIVKQCREITDVKEAEEFTQMKGCIGAIVHPSGQVWPYKFVHALLEIVLATGKLNLQAHTPVQNVGERDADGWIRVKTDRGEVKTKAVIHATNRWASHLLPDFDNLIFAGRATLAAIKAPEGFIKHTGAQHWDSVVNNYHLQLPPPYNSIVLGGAKPLTVHNPESFVMSDKEDEQIEGVPEFYHQWPKLDVIGWEGKEWAEFAKDDNKGGVWTGVYGTSVDSFPFVGPLPGQEGQFVAAGFTGHGMPRILLSTAHIVPQILKSLSIKSTPPSFTTSFPPLPSPFICTAERIEKLQKVDAKAYFQAQINDSLESSKKSFVKPKPISGRKLSDKPLADVVEGVKELGMA